MNGLLPPDPSELPQPSLLRRAWPAFAIVVLALVLLSSGVLDALNLDAMQREWVQLLSWSAEKPWLTAIAMAAVLTLLVSSGLPGGVVILVASGALFGTLAGTAIGVTGNILGGTTLYLATRRLAHGGRGRPPGWVERARTAFERAPAAYALSLRLVPIFPYGAASVALAWLGCRPLMFVLTSAAGILPATLIYAALGAGLSGAFASGAPVDAGLLTQPRVWLPLGALGVLASGALAFSLLRARVRPETSIGPA